jgi:CubicO group peptidase (beta-lactamase class C family)
MVSRVALLIGTAAALAACASAPVQCPTSAQLPPAPRNPTAADFEALDAYVRQAMADWNVPGLAMAVVKDDSVVFARGFGVREAGRPEPVDTRTLFGLLSPTKTFAAAALALLADDGLLSLDDRVVDHLPAFRVADAGLTADLRIRDLLSHRTGYGENHRLWYNRGGTRSDVAARTPELRAVAPPRTEFHYNNVMYVVAGEVVEAVSGVSWDEFVSHRLLLPLGMEESTTTHLPLAARDNVSSPHARRFFGRVGAVRPIPWFDTSNIGPAGSMHTNVDEMTAWLRLHLNDGTHQGRRLLPPDAVREMQTAHVPLPDLADPRIGGAGAWAPLCGVADLAGIGYGLGWFTLDFRGQPAVVHGGGINGQRSAVGLLPDQRAGVVIFSNLQDTEISLALMYHVFDMFLEAEPRDWSALYLRAN